MPDDVNKPVAPANLFTVDLKGSSLVGGKETDWYEVSGGGTLMEPRKVNDSDDRFQKWAPGKITYEDLTLTGPMVEAKTGPRLELLKWLKDWIEGKQTRDHCTITIKDDNGKTLRTVNFLEMFPVSYHPPSVLAGEPESLTETFVFRPARVEDKPA